MKGIARGYYPSREKLLSARVATKFDLSLGPFVPAPLSLTPLKDGQERGAIDRKERDKKLK